MIVKYWMIILMCLIGCSHQPKPWTDGQKVLAVAAILAASADAYTTMQALDNPNNWEMNPVLGKHPSDTKVIVYMALSQVIVMTVAHYWDDARVWLLGGKAVLNTGLAIHNSRLP